MIRRKLFFALVFALFISIFFASPVMADSKIGLIVDKEEITWDESVFGSIRMDNQRTLIPLRIVSSKLGYDVKWEGETKTAVVLKEGQEYRFTVDKSEIEKQIKSDALQRLNYVVVDTKPSLSAFELSEREKSVRSQLFELKTQYPEGMSWTNENRKYVWKDIVPGINAFTGYGCHAFAMMMSDKVFSNSEKAIEHKDVTNLKNKIKIGDILRLNQDTHSVIVIDRNETGVVITEGNYDSAVHWGRTMTYEELERTMDFYYTRYK